MHKELSYEFYVAKTVDKQAGFIIIKEQKKKKLGLPSDHKWFIELGKVAFCVCF